MWRRRADVVTRRGRRYMRARPVPWGLVRGEVNGYYNCKTSVGAALALATYLLRTVDRRYALRGWAATNGWKMKDR